MRFWDSSALVPLFVAEPATDRVQLWLKADPAITVWSLARVELMSMIARRERELSGPASDLKAARLQMMSAWDRWAEVSDLDNVRRHALRAIETHPLRAGDALQLGAALIASEGNPSAMEFVTLDRRLAEADEREGFSVLGPG